MNKSFSDLFANKSSSKKSNTKTLTIQMETADKIRLKRQAAIHSISMKTIVVGVMEHYKKNNETLLKVLSESPYIIEGEADTLVLSVEENIKKELEEIADSADVYIYEYVMTALREIGALAEPLTA